MHCRRLIEAIALLDTLAAAASAQTVREIPLSPDLHPIAVAISGDGESIAVAATSGNATSLQTWQGDAGSTFGPEFQLSGISFLNVTNTGRAFSHNWGGGNAGAGEWTSAGFIRVDAAGMLVRLTDVADDGSVQLLQNGEEFSIFSGSNDLADLPRVAPETRVFASAISADGRVVVGQSQSPAEGPQYRAVVWRDLIPTVLPIGSWTYAWPYDVSADGRIAAGYVQAPGRGFHAAMWIDDAGPMVFAPTMATVDFVCREGRVMYGSRDGRSVVWTPWAGVRNLTELGAPDFGNRRFPASVSRDGTKLVGLTDSQDPRPVLVSLPFECELDYATDGFIDFFDYAAFVACFEGDCPNDRSADFNMDGFVDFFDYSDFVATFERGC